MIVYPKTSVIEQALWSYLSNDPDVSWLADVMPIASDVQLDRKSHRGRVVIHPIDDIGHAVYISRQISDPIIQFSCWHFTYPEARLLSETVTDVLDRFHFDDTQHKLQSRLRLSSSGINFDSTTSLYVGVVIYQFNVFAR